MNERRITRWLKADDRLHSIAFAGIVAMLFLLQWQFWLRPVQATLHGLQQEAEAHAERYRQQFEALRVLPSVSHLEQALAELESQHAGQQTRPFSITAFLTARYGEMEYWKPAEKGGQLALRLSWQQFNHLLNDLALLRPAVVIPYLELQGRSSELRLQIELNYAS